jgi:two-component system, chemotaxis family, chemotaxis protein CheY
MAATAHSTRTPVSGRSFALDLGLISFLIIDDQPFSRRLVRSMLYGFGSREVYESAGGVEAIEIMRTTLPSIVITDLIMPDFNGLKFIQMMKAPTAPTRKIPIIVLSGYLTKTTALEVNRSGAEELLVKPVSPKTLYEHVSRILLRSDQPNTRMAFVQNQRRRAEQPTKKPDGGGVALL